MSNMKDDVSRIVESIGGAENIQSATHCVTRLRLILKDQSKVNVEALDNIDLVKGNFLAGGQFQIVIGTNVGKVYDEFIKQTNAKEVSRNDMKEEIVAKQNPLQRLVRLLGDIFIPIIPAIVASGLLMGLNNVNIDPKQMAHIEAIILSMTMEERRNPDILKASRKRRIASGSGRSVEEVNKLLKQFDQMKIMVKRMQNGNFKMPF